MTNGPNTPKPTLNQKRILDMSRFNALTGEVKFYFIWAVTRRNIKGRPFWSRVLSVRLDPPRKEHPL
jgi:hypothetical protein